MKNVKIEKVAIAYGAQENRYITVVDKPQLDGGINNWLPELLVGRFGEALSDGQPFDWEYLEPGADSIDEDLAECLDAEGAVLVDTGDLWRTFWRFECLKIAGEERINAGLMDLPSCYNRAFAARTGSDAAIEGMDENAALMRAKAELVESLADLFE